MEDIVSITKWKSHHCMYKNMARSYLITRWHFKYQVQWKWCALLGNIVLVARLLSNKKVTDHRYVTPFRSTGCCIYCHLYYSCLCYYLKLYHNNETAADIEGILPKGRDPPCLRMADRALLAGYPRYSVDARSQDIKNRASDFVLQEYTRLRIER